MKFQKKLTKKVKSIIHLDLIGSIAVVSVCMNIFFLVAIGIYVTTNSLDKAVYEQSQLQYCIENYEENLVDFMKNNDANPELARLYFEVECNQGDYSDYQDKAVQQYIEDKL